MILLILDLMRETSKNEMKDRIKGREKVIKVVILKQMQHKVQLLSCKAKLNDSRERRSLFLQRLLGMIFFVAEDGS